MNSLEPGGTDDDYGVLSDVTAPTEGQRLLAAIVALVSILAAVVILGVTGHDDLATVLLCIASIAAMVAAVVVVAAPPHPWEEPDG